MSMSIFTMRTRRVYVQNVLARKKHGLCPMVTLGSFEVSSVSMHNFPNHNFVLILYADNDASREDAAPKSTRRSCEFLKPYFK